MGHPLFRTKNIDKILRDAETMAEDPHAGAGLKRVLTLRDLTFLESLQSLAPEASAV